MLKGVYFTFSYAPVSVIISLRITIAITSAKGLIIFVFDISNAFQNTIITNPEERFYLSLPHLYLECFKIKSPTHPLAPINQKEICIQAIKYIQGTRSTGKLWYDLLKYLLITVKMIRSSSDHTVLSWIYRTYKSFLGVETYDIIMETQNRI